MANTKRIPILVLFIFQLLASPLWAATYYVDNTQSIASDKNPGTQTQPWVHCPGMIGWSGSANLVAGDTVYFASNGTWTNGTSSTFLSVVGGVTYDGASWGTGTKATFRQLVSDSNANRNGLIGFLNDNPTIPTVAKGFNLDGNGKLISGVNFNRPTPLRNLIGAAKIVENCIVHDLGDPGGTVFGEYGIVVGSGTSKNYDTENVEILNNTVYSTPRMGIAVYDAVSTGDHYISNVTVRGNNVYASGQGASVVGDGILFKDDVRNSVAEFNYIHDNLGRGFNIWNDPARPGPTGIVLRYNIIDNNTYGGIYIAQNASKSVDIYGNLIAKNNKTGSGGAGLYFESDLSNPLSIKVYNNTFYQNANGEILVSSAAKFTNFEVKNNIFYSLSGKTPIVNSSSSHITAHSNNIYYRPGGGTLVTEGSSYQASNIGSYESTGISADPSLNNVNNLPTGFTGTYGVNLAPNTDGLDINAKSPAYDQGATLSSTYNGSINSIARPLSAKWDIGAYQYSSITKSLSGLTISGPASVNGGSSATYSATATWSDGSTSSVTPVWSENSTYATISTGGVLTTQAVPSDQTATVSASYTSGGVTKPATKLVTITYVSPTKTLSGLTISGPASVNESSSATYTATASWSDGSTSAVTPVWSVNSAYANISTAGVLTTLAVSSNQSITVNASYASSGVTKSQAVPVVITYVPTTTTTTTPPATVPTGGITTTLSSLAAPMQKVTDSTAPGGSYIETTTSDSGSAVYSFNTTQAGTYKIVGEVYTADNGSDSFNVSVDNGTADIWDMNPTGDTTLYGIWRQDDVTARGTGTFDAPQYDPLTVQLAAGSHTITFSGREAGARLAYAYLVLVTPAAVPPSPDNAVMLFRADSGTLSSTMNVVTSIDAPGGTYITPTSTTSATAVYNFNITQAGTYKIVAEVYTPDNGSDSFNVSVDNGKADTWDMNPSGDATLYGVWRQDEVTARGAGTFDAPQFNPLKIDFTTGAHTITISGRELNARLAYFYVVMIPATTATIEAESGILTSPMAIVSDTTASGGAYISTPTSDSGSAVYTFNIVQPGQYKIIANVYAPDNASDSFDVKIDSGTADIWDLNPSGDSTLYGVWRQDAVTARGNGTFDAPQYDPLIVQLSAGMHTITFSGRESNTRLDNFFLQQVIPVPLIKKIEITP